MQEIPDLVAQAKQQIAVADNLQLLEDIRVHYLGKKGQVTELLKQLGQLPGDQRREAGQVINQAKQDIVVLLQAQQKVLQEQQLAAQLATQTIDVTLPGRGAKRGAAHPVIQTQRRLEAIFKEMGFAIEQGNEIESEQYNFDKLNIPANHPARAMHDTFYVSDEQVLRTHTSPTQIHYMEKQQPPIRMIAPGRVYRCDSDLTHTPMFHQIEGLVVDEQTNFAQMKGLLESVIQHFFARELAMRFRPSYFPFTEPSAEVDMQCVNCGGQGCRVCSHTGWLEILGCGMVHPSVLQAGGVDSHRYRGFAFGMGIDRLTMLRYGIDDLRLLFSNDLRLLKQFA
jgi:phenylalanyl-tRNA synthetase alpha chain